MTGFTPGDLKATGSATSVTRYYYSGQQLVEGDTAVNGVTTTRYQYLWSPRYIDAPILRDTLNTDGSVNLGDRIFYLTDANYNVTAVVGMSGGSWQVVEPYRYDAYGKVTVCSPNGNPIGGNASQFGNTILYAGETFDSSTGLYYDRARYYDPQLGRFISQDPMSAAGSGSNLYAYCGDNPTDATDPSGELLLDLIAGPDATSSKRGRLACHGYPRWRVCEKQGEYQGTYQTGNRCPDGGLQRGRSCKACYFRRRAFPSRQGRLGDETRLLEQTGTRVGLAQTKLIGPKDGFEVFQNAVKAEGNRETESYDWMVVEMEGLEDAGKVEVLDQEIPQYQAIQDLYNAYGGKGQFARVVCFANPGKPTEKGWFFVADGKVLHDNQNKVCGIGTSPCLSG